MKILILGASGQLGSEFKYISSGFSNLIFFFASKNKIDITNYKSILSFVKHNNINTIINCAAYTDVDNAEDNSEKAYEINAHAVKNIVDICEICNLKLIHISTDYVFDGSANIAYCETDNVNPVGVYAKSKLMGEQYIVNSCSEAIVIRTSWLYSMFSNNFMKTILKLSNTRNTISVVNDQFGTPCFARDLAFVILELLLDTKALNVDGPIYHYSNQGVASWYDFAHAICSFAKKNTNVIPVNTKQYPTKAKRPVFSVLDKEKIQNRLSENINHWTISLENCMSEIIK